MTCSMSGRRDNRLPQMHAARISIRDHLITSTLSQVESYEFEYFTTNLRRMTLVTDALITVNGCYRRTSERGGTYKDPILIKKMTAIFFLVLICSFHTTGRGRSKIMMSSTILRAAPVKPIATDTGRHFAPVIVLSQRDLIGQH